MAATKRTRGYRHKLKYRKLRLNIERKINWGWSNTVAGCLEWLHVSIILWYWKHDWHGLEQPTLNDCFEHRGWNNPSPEVPSNCSHSVNTQNKLNDGMTQQLIKRSALRNWKNRWKFTSPELRSMEVKLGMLKGELQQESILINKKSTTKTSGKTEHRFQWTNGKPYSES